MSNWYKIAQLGDTSPLNQLMAKWVAQGVRLWLYEKDGVITLDDIVVPKESRKQGIGSQIMNEIVEYADATNQRLILSPATRDDYHGTTSRGRLVKFYKRFGFLENKGRNKDFTLSKEMYRNPVQKEQTNETNSDSTTQL